MMAAKRLDARFYEWILLTLGLVSKSSSMASLHVKVFRRMHQRTNADGILHALKLFGIHHGVLVSNLPQKLYIRPALSSTGEQMIWCWWW